MNKTSKIFLGIIIILTILLIGMTIMFYNMRKLANFQYGLYEIEKDKVEKAQKRNSEISDMVEELNEKLSKYETVE